jgi:hypothetical protein
MPTCRLCQNEFLVSPLQRQLYAEIGLRLGDQLFSFPEPSICPSCRRRQKLAFRTDRHLFKRRCDYSQREILSQYSPDRTHKVWANEYFSNRDLWDPADYAKEYDPGRSFFEQWRELYVSLPHPALQFFPGNENCDYCNGIYSSKNSYLCFMGDFLNSCAYCYYSGTLTDCIECSCSLTSELCYRLIACADCYNCDFLYRSVRCSDSGLLRHCEDCTYCFECVNLSHKRYCIRNQQLSSKQEYEAALERIRPRSRSAWHSRLVEFEAWSKQFPLRGVQNKNCEDCSGHDLQNCKGMEFCFSVMGDDNRECSECRDMGHKVYRCVDCNNLGYDVTHCREIINAGVSLHDSAFCQKIVGGHEIFYSFDCEQCDHLLGCVHLKHRSYCILNRQYSPQEYASIVPTIIERMRADAEWGEYFPMSYSLVGFNQSAATDFAPCTRELAERCGAVWSDYEALTPEIGEAIPSKDIPDQAQAVTPDLLAYVFQSARSGKPFRLQRREIEFYQRKALPLPDCTPLERIESLATGYSMDYQLYEVRCSRCAALTPSVYPAGSGILYCEDCYRETR